MTAIETKQRLRSISLESLSDQLNPRCEIREIMAKFKWSQKDLALMMDMREATISELMNDKADITIKLASRLGEVLENPQSIGSNARPHMS